jgi:alpha-tubulin suppressor-like RCC1 family protein
LHTCIRFESGAVACFGSNQQGQIGDGTSGAGADRPSPVLIPEIPDAVQVETGSQHTCALRRQNGEVWCWGNNARLQQGDGGAPDEDNLRPTPTRPVGGAVQQIALGSLHSCARTETQVACWGDNFFGQAGQNNTLLPLRFIALPVAVEGITSPSELTTGSNHTCVRVSLPTPSFYCFGPNLRNQLGDGTTTDSWMPVMVQWP